MIAKYGKKCTAKQLAAEIINDSVFLGLEFWGEKVFVDFDQMTDAERAEVDRQLDNYMKRVRKMLEKGMIPR